MDRVIRQVETQDLGGGEMGEMLRGVADIKMYSALQGATMSSWFTKPAIALLFPVSSANDGHWLGMWVDTSRRIVYHFDSYGFGPDMEIRFSQDPIVQKRLLQVFYAMCQKNGYQVVTNTTPYQKLDGGINTCGRHVITRLRLRYLDPDDYDKLMMGQKLTPDSIVTYFTFLALNEDQEDKAQILKALGGPGSKLE